MKNGYDKLRIALVAALCCTAAAGADTQGPAGMVKTSRGSVTVDRAGQPSPAAPGTPVFVGDRVRTGPASAVGITLRDDTLLTAGPDSTLLITEFRFDAGTREGSLLASLFKGTFSVVTGLIAKQNPRAMNFKTPTMTLGIRGTEFIVEVEGKPE